MLTKLPMYGIRIVNNVNYNGAYPTEEWLIDGNGTFFWTDYIGHAMAYAQQRTGEFYKARACIIGEDGNPIEIEKINAT